MLEIDFNQINFSSIVFQEIKSDKVSGPPCPKPPKKGSKPIKGGSPGGQVDKKHITTTGKK